MWNLKSWMRIVCVMLIVVAAATLGWAQSPIEGVRLAVDDGSGHAAKKLVSSFKPTDNPLHCVVTLRKPKAGTRVGFRWIAVNAGGSKNQLIDAVEFKTQANQDIIDGKIGLPRPWPLGEYKVEVSLNGRSHTTLVFDVKND